MQQQPFWQTKKLAEMSVEEWESLCDRCGKCCLHKLENEESGEIFFTSVVCDLIDLERCSCTDYVNRCTLVPDCIDMKQRSFTQYHWLPSTCAYRLLEQGEALPSWHPLITNDPESVHEAGVSIRSYAIPESDAGELIQHIIEWNI